MKQDSLKSEIEIAGLSFQFYCKREGDASFLREKYLAFLPQKKVKQPVAKIFFTDLHFKKIRVEGNKFYLPQIGIRKNFRQFNDLLRMVVGYVLNRNRGFVFHASSLVKDGFGYIFIGREDAGKSTVRRLFPHLVCLGDDSAIVREINKQFFLFGSPFYQRTQKVYPNKKVPIKGVFSLHQANFNLVKLLTFPEDVKALSTDSFIADIKKKSEERKLIFEKAVAFCHRNKIFSLFFQKNSSFWPLLEKASGKNFFKGDKDKILAMVNPQVKKKLPSKLSWTAALGSGDFLGKCLVIKEASWNFEFDGKRQVAEVARMAGSSKRSSSHIELINRIRRKLKKRDFERWIVLIESKGLYTIIDGNHLAITFYLEGKDREGLKFLIAKLPSQKKCLWV